METKILIFATNIKMRFYSHWCHRVLNLPTLAKGDSFQTNNPIQDTVRCSVYSIKYVFIHSIVPCTINVNLASN